MEEQITEQTTKGLRIGLVGALILIVILSFFFLRDKEKEESGTILETATTTSTGISVEQQKIPTPNLDRLVVGTNDLSESARQKVLNELKTLSAQLKNISTADGWNELGVLRRVLGDYEGARIAWEYASLIDPNSYVSYWNLGDLYHFYLKDYPKAETYFKKSVEKNVAFSAGYQALVELYTYSYKEKMNQIPVVLLDGIGRNSNAYDLMLLLARYYKDTGDTTNATKYYTLSASTAGKLGKTDDQKAIEEELKSL